MELKNKTVEELEARKAEILTEMTADDADTKALKEEMRAIVDELEARKAKAAEREEIRRMVASGAGQVVAAAQPAPEKPVEVRNSPAYIEAYARYIKTGDDREARALLTENVSGTLPVPEFIDGIIRTAWERDGIVSRVRRTFFRGNLRVPFELSATGAWVHTEGTTAVTEETLTLGIVEMRPATVKKWITISDEAMAMGGEAFLRYIYDELAYQIVKKLAELIVADITGSPTSSDSDEVGVPKVTMAPSTTTIATAAANLSDEARDVVIIMNRLT